MLDRRLTLAKVYDSCRTKKPALTVVMIHGIASDSSAWNRALEHFENTPALNKVRFVTFDLLGSGKSLKDDSLNYDYKDQLEALQNSIADLILDSPLVLVGHSLGTFIVTRYAATHKSAVQKLILVSPPIYTSEEFSNPAFAIGIKAFKDAVSVRNHKILQEKAFNNSMDKIVLDKSNYQTLANIKTDTVLIYGDEDQIIASYNIPRLLKENPEHISAIKTVGRHGVTKDKYNKLEVVLKETLNEKS